MTRHFLGLYLLIVLTLAVVSWGQDRVLELYSAAEAPEDKSMRVAAAALAEGRDYVLPDDLKGLALPVLAHRVVAASPAEIVGRARQDVERVLTDILERVPAPG